MPCVCHRERRVKSRENKHQRRDEDAERAHNVLHFDYCFFADVVDVYEDTVDLTQKPHAVLVGYDSDSGSMIGVQVKCKGKGDTYAVGAVRNWIRSLGITSGVLQADGEESIQAFLREVAKGVEIPLVLRVSALGDKQSNGAAESAVGVLKRQIKVICSQLNVSYEIVLGPRSWLFPWIVRHCGWSVTRFVPRGPQKRSGYALRHGCAYTGQVLAFGECCIGKELLADKNKKGAWHTGVFVGKSENDCFLVATRQGVIQCRSVRRLEESKQWDKKLLLEVGGTPWNLRKEGVVPAVADVMRVQPLGAPPVADQRTLLMLPVPPSNRFCVECGGPYA